MITDAQLTLSDAQALTATANSTNVLDTLAAGNDIFVGTPLALHVSVDVAMDFTTGDESYVIAVVASAAAALTSPTTLVSRTVLAAERAAGSRIIIPVPPLVKILRYVGVVYTLGGTTPTATVTSILQPWNMIDQQKFYADAITISG